MVMASAAAVPSSSREALEMAMPVRSHTMVWKLSRDSSLEGQDISKISRVDKDKTSRVKGTWQLSMAAQAKDRDSCKRQTQSGHTERPRVHDCQCSGCEKLSPLPTHL